MKHRHLRRATAWLAAAALCFMVVGCGESPLESVGERSSEWIGPVADGVTFLSNDTPAEGAGDDPSVGPVSASEGDG